MRLAKMVKDLKQQINEIEDNFNADHPDKEEQGLYKTAKAFETLALGSAQQRVGLSKDIKTNLTYDDFKNNFRKDMYSKFTNQDWANAMAYDEAMRDAFNGFEGDEPIILPEKEGTKYNDFHHEYNRRLVANLVETTGNTIDDDQLNSINQYASLIGNKVTSVDEMVGNVYENNRDISNAVEDQKSQIGDVIAKYDLRSTSLANQNVMSGKQVELYAKSMKPIEYKTKDGKKELGALVETRKRADVKHQHSKFDGAYVTNRRLKHGAVSHKQLVNLDTALGLLAASGQDVKSEDDFRKDANAKVDYASETKPLTFKANVFAEKGANYGDYKFNPDPYKLVKSDVDFDTEVNKQAENVREQEHQANKQRYEEKHHDKDDGLEP